MRMPTLIGAFLVAAVALADIRPAPGPRVFVSPSGEFFFAMLPPKPIGAGDDDPDRNGSGMAYRLYARGEMEELWRLSGWYSSDVFISDDGEHLVRMGIPPTHGDVSYADLAVAFYRKGTLLRQYSTKDMIRNPDKIGKRGQCEWRLDLQHLRIPTADLVKYKPRLYPDNQFHIFTADGFEHIFDITTGIRIKSEPIEGLPKESSETSEAAGLPEGMSALKGGYDYVIYFCPRCGRRLSISGDEYEITEAGSYSALVDRFASPCSSHRWEYVASGSRNSRGGGMCSDGMWRFISGSAGVAADNTAFCDTLAHFGAHNPEECRRILRWFSTVPVNDRDIDEYLHRVQADEELKRRAAAAFVDLFADGEFRRIPGKYGDWERKYLGKDEEAASPKREPAAGVPAAGRTRVQQ